MKGVIIEVDTYSKIRTLYTEGESIRSIARRLGVSRQTVKKYCEGDTSNYWESTAANAIKPLYQLIALAKMRPDCVWDGD